MPLFGGSKKPSRKKRLQAAFSEPQVPTARERLAWKREEAKDALIAKLAREKKNAEERQAAVDKADAIKAKALAKREAAEKAAKKKKPAAAAAERTACTCRRPTLDRAGKCRRCHKFPASRRRRRL